MRVLCIQGIHSSAGTSTVVANTARTLKELGQDVLVFDLNPNNLLRLHFNMDWQNPAGWALNMSKKKSWFTASFECEQGIRFIPFGQIDYKKLQSFSIVKNWLSDQLTYLNLSSETWVILNVSSELNALSTQALKSGDIIIRVIEPDINSLSQVIDSIQSSYIYDNDSLADKVFYLINKLATTSQLDYDVALVLKKLLLEKIIPVNIHFDENIKEALANKTTVTVHAPESPATDEFKAFAIWLTTHFN